MSHPVLQIVTASTREGRKGPAVAAWFEQLALEQDKFEIESIDLKVLNLPMFDEPEHPRLRRYKHDHTKAWSAIVQRADAFVFVVPEYNFSAPPSLLNALDYLAHEWNYTAVGFVSYGGVSGGLRSVQMLKQTVTALKMMPMMEGVALPMFTTAIEAETGRFVPPDIQRKSGFAMLEELLRWTMALQSLRAESRALSAL